MGRATKGRVRLAKDARPERRASTRFPLALDVRYFLSCLGRPTEMGSGRTIDLSRSGLRFTADGSLEIGQKLDVALDWPVLLDGGLQLQLHISGVVVRASGTEIALRIQRHEFRTRHVGPKATSLQK